MNNDATQLDRPRVLVIAEAANPEWFSVPLEGWSLSRALFGVARPHVVTQVRNREAMTRAGWQEGREFTALDSEAIARPVHKLSTALRGDTGKAWTLGVAFSTLSYYYFERLLWKRFGRDIRSGAYDLVHRVTPLSPTTPSIIAGKCRRAGLPFVWGPINGGVPWPKGFDAVRRKEREWLSYVRGAYRFLPGYSAARRNAAALIIGSRDTFEQMPDRYRGKCVYVPENAVEAERFTRRVERPIEPPLRVAFTGRLVPYKGADMLLEAAAPLIRAGKLKVDIIGDGPEMPRLREFVEQNGLGQGVALDGWVPHEQMQARLVQSDVFGFPSIREFGGAVVLEAMALGLVPIVVDYGGPGELVTEKTGFRIPIGPRSDIVARFRETLEGLAADPSAIRAMGARARARVMTHFTWEAKARQLREVYDWALGRAGKPGFGMPIQDSQQVRVSQESLQEAQDGDNGRQG